MKEMFKDISGSHQNGCCLGSADPAKVLESWVNSGPCQTQMCNGTEDSTISLTRIYKNKTEYSYGVIQIATLTTDVQNKCVEMLFFHPISSSRCFKEIVVISYTKQRPSQK